MMGREYGGDDSNEDTVDLPVAIEPVSPIISIFFFSCIPLLSCCLVLVGGEVECGVEPRFFLYRLSILSTIDYRSSALKEKQMN